MTLATRVRTVEDLDRVHRRQRSAGACQVSGDLHETADVTGGDGICAPDDGPDCPDCSPEACDPHEGCGFE